MRPAAGRTAAVAALLLTVGLVLAQPQARNIILMIPDGCGFSTATLARWYSGRPLALDAMLRGAVRTSAGNSIITESAAAATALATGHKTSGGVLGLGPGPGRRLTVATAPPDSLESRPLATLLEAARLQGKATGLVATCAFPHATPAGFAAHIADRGEYEAIASQMAHQGIDILFAGGRGWLRPRSRGGLREDSLDLAELLARRGCRLVATSAEMSTLRTAPAWGLFAEEDMRPDADRGLQAAAEPSLAAMTAKAIELLSRDTDGFFLMVEGSQVDWAGHANDPFYAVTDFLAFDSAVQVAVDFAARDSHTLVVACPDHNCGGLSIGSATSTVGYDSTGLDDLLGPLRRMKLTSKGLVREIGADTSAASIRTEVERWWGVTLSDDELAEVRRLHALGTDLDHSLSEVFSHRRTVLGWTSHGHTGEDVPLWTFGPGSPHGLLDNTDVAQTIARAAELDLAAATRELFADLGRPDDPGGWRLDTAAAGNHALLIGDTRLPLNTDLRIAGPDTMRLSGITVYSPGIRRAYAPAAVRGLLAALRPGPAGSRPSDD